MKIAVTCSDGEVQIFLDKAGRDALVEALNDLEEWNGDPKCHEHFHMFTEAAGGYDLSELNDKILHKISNTTVNHFKVSMVVNGETKGRKAFWKNVPSQDV